MLQTNDYQQLERMLWQSTRRFQALIENSSDIVFILDGTGIFRYASPSMHRILGFLPEHIIGQSIHHFTHSDDLKLIKHTLKAACGSPGLGLPEIEIRLRHQDGSWRVLLATFTNLLNNQAVTGILVNCHDITLHKQATEQLKSSQLSFQQLVTSISDHIYVTEIHPDGYHVNRYISPNVVDFTGYPVDNFMADRYFWPSTIIHPDDRAAAAIQAAYLDLGRDSEMEYRLTHADGSIIWVRDSAKVYRDGSCKIVYGIVSNISDRKRLESQLLQAQKLDAVSRLAGGIAHDFNNLLTIVIGNCQLILDDLEPDDPHREFIEHTYKAGNKAAALTNQLLTFSHQQVHYPQPLDLNALITGMDYTLRRLLGNNIDLVTILEPSLSQLSADAEQMERVIINLILNARDAMPTGGEVTITTANKFLDERATGQYVGLKAGEYVMLSVQDIGLGMDEETKSHMFEPYFSTKKRGQGPGLGLSTVYGMIKQNGGHTWVESSPRQGTQVNIYLPRLQSHFPAGTLGLTASNPFRRGATILLVSAEHGSAEQTLRNLINFGHILLKARNGQEAYQVYKHYSGTIDLLIIELAERWDDFEVDLAKHLQALHPEMHILLLYPHQHDTTLHRALNAQQLTRPFTSHLLINKVTQLLNSATHP